MKFDMEPGWDENVAAQVDLFLDENLGPKIVADAQRYAPVRTGELRGSIGHHLEGHDLVVDATATYAAYVEMGHRIAHGPRLSEAGPKVKPPRPFLRPALYQERAE